MTPSALEESWKAQLRVLGEFIRTQRKLANLSLREMAALTDLSNAYLSQVERGLHEPSVRVLRAIAEALGLRADALLAEVGIVGDRAEPRGSETTEAAIRSDPALSEEQKEALLSVYRSYRPKATRTSSADGACASMPAAAGGSPRRSRTTIAGSTRITV
jgi:transcriptional regulator with XRE-family HTH domain